ncbi:hypothetical protein BDW22DRAFT_271587 [Trametopsis cervina]|nr:hypothetical protein BDW22DRAFT_271587 [Trametopsis cervina]
MPLINTPQRVAPAESRQALTALFPCFTAPCRTLSLFLGRGTLYFSRCGKEGLSLRGSTAGSEVPRSTRPSRRTSCSVEERVAV